MKKRRALSLVIAFTMLISLFTPFSGGNVSPADAATDSNKVIASFDGYDPYDVFTPYDKVTIKDSERKNIDDYLPDTIPVVTESGKKVDAPVTWECMDDITSTQYDLYVYEMRLDGGYVLSDELQSAYNSWKIALPYIEVKVKAPAADSGDTGNTDTGNTDTGNTDTGEGENTGNEGEGEDEETPSTDTEVTVGYAEEESSMPFSDIKDTWKDLPDEELNKYVGNNSDTEIYDFLMGLSEEDRELFLSKDTMLNNELTVEDENGNVTTLPYKEYILNGLSTTPRATRDTYSATSGYCYYRFTDTNSGYWQSYKVSFKITNNSDITSTTNGYTLSYAKYNTSGTNSNNVDFSSVTFAKSQDYLKRGRTTSTSLGNTSYSYTSDAGTTYYRTKACRIFVIKVTVKKPAYYSSGWTTNDALASGSRFNFRAYNWQNTGTSTFNTNVYTATNTETYTSQIDILSTGITRNAASSDASEHDVMYVTYTKPSLSLSFNPNGGSGTAVTKSLLYNNKYNASSGLPSPAELGFAKTGYHAKSGAEWINGSTTWSESNAAVTAYNLKSFTSGTYFTSQSQTLYANWTPNTYYVKYDGNGADSGSMSNSTMTYNTASNLTANAYSKEGKVFNGWNTKADGSGTAYADAASVKNLTATNGGTVTLYAQWVDEEFTLHYDGNGADSGSMPDDTFNFDTKVTLSDNQYSKGEYYFGGWNTEPDGSGVMYENGENVTFSNNGSSEVTLYAQWYKGRVNFLDILWNDNEDEYGQRPETFEMEVYQNGDLFDTYTYEEGSTSYSYYGIAVDLPLSRYDASTGTDIPFAYEFEADMGDYKLTYVSEPEEVSYTPLSARANNGTVMIMNLEYTYAPDIIVEKEWLDADNSYNTRPEEVTVELLRDGEVIDEMTISEADDGTWTGTFTGKPLYDTDGNEYTYMVREKSVPDGYAVTYESTSGVDYDYLFKIKNKVTTNIPVKKVWVDEDNEYDSRPESVVFELLRNGEVVDEITLSESDNWEGEFTNLDKYDEDGNFYEYTIQEQDVPTGYEASEPVKTIKGMVFRASDYTIVFEYKGKIYTVEDDDTTDDTITVPSTKVYLIGSDTSAAPEFVSFVDCPVTDTPGTETTVPEAGSVDANYYYEVAADGTVTASTEEEMNSPRFSLGGHYRYVFYSNDYTTDQESYIITNTLVDIPVNVPFEKVWDDQENAHNTRPNAVTFELLQNGDVIDEMTVTAGDDWKGEFTNLSSIDEDGNPYEYTVQEQEVPAGYTSSTKEKVTGIKTVATGALGGKVYYKYNDKLYELNTANLPADRVVKIPSTSIYIYCNVNIAAPINLYSSCEVVDLEAPTELGDPVNEEELIASADATDVYEISETGEITNITPAGVDKGNILSQYSVPGETPQYRKV